MATDAWGREIVEGVHGCHHQFPDGTFCARGSMYHSDWCFAHRPRPAGAKHTERNARLALKLAREARGVAAAANRDAREAYEGLREAVLDEAIEIEAVLPKKLREIVAQMIEAERKWRVASKALRRREAEEMAADDAYETARRS